MAALKTSSNDFFKGEALRILITPVKRHRNWRSKASDHQVVSAYLSKLPFFGVEVSYRYQNKDYGQYMTIPDFLACYKEAYGCA